MCKLQRKKDKTKTRYTHTHTQLAYNYSLFILRLKSKYFDRAGKENHMPPDKGITSQKCDQAGQMKHRTPLRGEIVDYKSINTLSGSEVIS